MVGWQVRLGMWCSGITFALHAKGPEFDPRHLHNFLLILLIFKQLNRHCKASKLQTGHFLEVVSHLSTHSMWYSCLHLSFLNKTPFLNLSIHIVHVSLTEPPFAHTLAIIVLIYCGFKPLDSAPDFSSSARSCS